MGITNALVAFMDHGLVCSCVFFGAFTPLFRYLAFHDPNSFTPKENRMRRWHIRLTVASIVAFGIASVLIAIGGFKALPCNTASLPWHADVLIELTEMRRIMGAAAALT